MVPARNLLRRQYNCYGVLLSADSSFCSEKMRSREYMEEEPSRGCVAGELVNGREPEDEEEEDEGAEAEAGKCSRQGGGEEEDWLRLGIGVGVTTSASRRSPATSSSTAARRTELELFEGSATAATAAASVSTMMPMFHLPVQHGVFYRRDFPWGFWNAGGPAMANATSAFVSSAVETPLAGRRFMFPLVSSGASTETMQVVSPPPRPWPQAAGVWFLLQASQNQEREPFLPQIPKSYLRIKDGRMTVRLLKKYLVNKLGLEDESEVQIWCRGQPLPPFFTLQHVRDNIWRLRERPAPFSLLPDPPVVEHLMTLQYGRSL